MSTHQVEQMCCPTFSALITVPLCKLEIIKSVTYRIDKNKCLLTCTDLQMLFVIGSRNIVISIIMFFGETSLGAASPFSSDGIVTISHKEKRLVFKETLMGDFGRYYLEFHLFLKLLALKWHDELTIPAGYFKPTQQIFKKLFINCHNKNITS